MEKYQDLYDALVIIRGGGSLESLQAFNNEALVRAVQSCQLPVLAGIGHERDVTLVALVADQMESTPTACALRLTVGWQAASEQLVRYAHQLPRLFSEALHQAAVYTEHSQQQLQQHLQALMGLWRKIEQQFVNVVQKQQESLQQQKTVCAAAANTWRTTFTLWLNEATKQLQNQQQVLDQLSPERVLQLGYSLVRQAGKVLKSADQLQQGDILEVQFGRGAVTAEVKRVTK